MRVFLIVLSSLCFLFFSHCSPGLNEQIEMADFLLDQGKFQDAVNFLEILDNRYPDNIEIKTRLASAHISNAVLTDDRSYLGLVADYFEDKEAGETDFGHFSRKSPQMTQENMQEIGFAKTILKDEIPDGIKNPKEWLQLGFARLLEINYIGVVLTGALGEDNYCNADPLKGPDGIPDDYDSSALTGENEAMFDEDVSAADDDFVNAGLPEDKGIIPTIRRISDDLAALGNLQNYMDSQFTSACPP